MNRRKPKILFCNEFSLLNTGYSTYGLEVMSRLHKKDKYELAELASYLQDDSPQVNALPWKVFPNEPSASDIKAQSIYRSNQLNEFGAWRFEETLLKFQPDIVFAITDWWMHEYQERSPFRRFYNWAIMPTVDATPQHEQWISTFMNADAVFSYSDWGADTLREEGGGLINVKGSAPPGADLETFFPMDKKQLRKKFSIDEDCFIVGTVMRNQGRKLYPELMEAFALFLKQAPPDMAKKTYLYLHTSYPDQGWDIPRLIKRTGIGHKVLVTYKCHRCACVFPSYFMDTRAACPKCGNNEAYMPNVRIGVDRPTLAMINNFFDAYVQYANSEGFGMPQVEAAACGVPVFATDYSAMCDVVRKVKGYPIKVAHLKMDNDFGCYRATPDNQDFVDKLIRFLSKSDRQRIEEGKKARLGVETHYTWDQTASRWEQVFDEFPIKDAWTSPPRLHTPKKPPTTFTSNDDFVRWCIEHVFGRPEALNSYLTLRLIRDLNWKTVLANFGASTYHNETSFLESRVKMREFTEEDVIKELTELCNNWNMWETRRGQLIGSKL